jgi:hypothetical protein
LKSERNAFKKTKANTCTYKAEITPTEKRNKNLDDENGN